MTILDSALRYIDQKITEAEAKLADIQRDLEIAERELHWLKEERKAVIDEAALGQKKVGS